MDKGQALRSGTCVMKVMKTGGLCPILSLRSTHVSIVQSTRETGDIDKDRNGYSTGRGKGTYLI